MNTVLLTLMLIAVIATSLFSSYVRAVLGRWREYLWLLLILAVAYAAYRIIPSLDPRSGIDGFGDIFNTLVMAAKAVFAASLAYVCKRQFSGDLTDTEEDALRAKLAAKPEPVPPPAADDAVGREIYFDRSHHANESARAERQAAFRVLLSDRLGWIVWLAFFAFALLR